jgi:hypothetical protein
MNYISEWLLKGHRLEICIMLLTLLIVLTIVLSVNTILFTTVYWIVRSTFDDFPRTFLLAYGVVSSYLIFVTSKLARESYQRDVYEKSRTPK